MCSTLLRVQNEMPIRNGAGCGNIYNEMEREFGVKGIKDRKKSTLKPLVLSNACKKEDVEVCRGDWRVCRECQLPVPRFYPRQVSPSAELETTGWYYGPISRGDCDRLLARTKPGTFLVRDSSDPRYIFTLSLQTRQGPFSVRLLGSGSVFRLEADPLVICQMPVFRSVVALVQHYAETDTTCWIDWRGVCHSDDVKPVRPLYRQIPSLQHLARLAVNRSVPSNRQPFPKSIQSYLDRYPYTL